MGKMTYMPAAARSAVSDAASHAAFPAPRSALLRAADWRAALDLVGDTAAALGEPGGYARCLLQQLPRLVASDLTTLSICDLQEGRRRALGAPALGAAERAAFDHHFHAHPLVRYHAVDRGPYAHRISDSVPFAHFREGGLYADYYRRVGIDHVLALPVHVQGRWLVSVVFNRRGRDFSDRELALLDALRRPLATLFAHADVLQPTEVSMPATTLTPREHEVLGWVAAGKTDRDIAALLGTSPGTVRKQLQRVYTKLGVETRTAAAMRALQLGWLKLPPAAQG
jgi:DNA-binding CsgD family transcriptional regulator